MFSNKTTYSLLQFITLLLMVILTLPFPTTAARQTELTLYGKGKSSSQLLADANRRLEGKASPDSSLMIYSIVINRYSHEAATEHEAIDAYFGKWRVFFYYYYDYSKSVETLSDALKISEKEGYKAASICHALGVTYQTIGEQSGDQQYLKQAYDYYRRAWQLSKDKNHGDFMDILMSNLINISYRTGELKQLDSYLPTYHRSRVSHPTFLYRYNMLLYKGYGYLSQNRPESALSCFEEQSRLLGKDTIYVRYHTMVLLDMASAYAQMGNYTKAISEIESMCGIASRYGVKDALMEGYDLKAQYYFLNGNTSKSNLCRIRFYELKDSMITSQQIKNIEGHLFSSKMQAAETALKKMEEHRQRQQNIGIILALFIVFVMTFAYILYRKNRTLKERNLALYEKITTMSKKTEPVADSGPYKNSNLDAADKQTLLDKIKSVMETREEIYSTEFNLEQLTELVNSKYKKVSQVINESYHCNFNVYINEYRIKEACRRINDFEHYGNMSLEGIGHSVGFKARSSFFTAFKNVTGMTPSDYAKIAKQSNAHN